MGEFRSAHSVPRGSREHPDQGRAHHDRPAGDWALSATDLMLTPAHAPRASRSASPGDESIGRSGNGSADPVMAIARIWSSSGSRQTRGTSTNVTTSAIASSSARTAAARLLVQSISTSLEFAEDRGTENQHVITRQAVLEETRGRPPKWSAELQGAAPRAAMMQIRPDIVCVARIRGRPIDGEHGCWRCGLLAYHESGDGTDASWRRPSRTPILRIRS